MDRFGPGKSGSLQEISEPAGGSRARRCGSGCAKERMHRDPRPGRQRKRGSVGVEARKRGRFGCKRAGVGHSAPADDLLQLRELPAKTVSSHLYQTESYLACCYTPPPNVTMD